MRAHRRSGPVALMGLLAGLATVTAARAEEGGGSVYVQGAYNDFAAALTGPPGLYLRNDFAVYDAGVGARPLGGALDAGIDEVLLLNLVKLAWVMKGSVLGGTPTLAVVVPIVPDVDVNARLAGPGFAAFRTGDSGGLGDVIILPGVNWTAGNHHFTMSVGVSAPVGRYSKDKALNLSRNYWAFDPQLAYTYLDPATGFDFSATSGFLINSRNDATGYKSGPAFHIDALLAKHFASGQAVGLVGYWYKQVGDDDGPASPLVSRGFRGSAVGVGPAVMGTIKTSGGDLSLIAKWLHDLDTTNRFRGDLIMFSLGMKL